MKKHLKQLAPLLAMVVLVACTDYGKKITIDGTKGEVYYKGKGVSESDAKDVGEYLKDISFFSNSKPATVQITNQDDAYTVRFVYDKTYYEQHGTVENAFKTISAELSKKIFRGKKVNIALSDSLFKDFKTIAFDPNAVAQTNGSSSLGSGSDNDDNGSRLGSDDDNSNLVGYDHETRSGILFYWKDVSTDDMKVIADYIIKSGDFSGGNGNVNIIVNKEAGDHYVVRFPINSAYVDDTKTQMELEKVAQKIKDNVFAKQSYSFVITDTKLNKIKSWDY